MEDPDKRNPGWGAGGSALASTDANESRDSTSAFVEQEIATIQRSEREEIGISLSAIGDYRVLKFRVHVFDDDGRIPILLGFTVRIDKLDELIATLVKARSAAVLLGWPDEPTGRSP